MAPLFSTRIWRLALPSLTAAALAGWLMYGTSGGRHPVSPEDFPWHVEHTGTGTTRVLGIELGVSRSHDAAIRLRTPLTPGLFLRRDGTLAAEAYAERIELGGLQAKVVLGITATPAQLRAILERSPGVSAVSQDKKVSLDESDAAWLLAQPVYCLTYLPAARLSEADLIQRFGPPAQRLVENGETVHLLYPPLGLDITVGNGSKPILQYVRPADFSSLILAPLKPGPRIERRE